MKVLTIKTDGLKPIAERFSVEIHMLNPGDTFPGFGGSSSGLVVRKTASLVTRTTTSTGTSDVELDIHNPETWQWLARLINTNPGVRADANA